MFMVSAAHLTWVDHPSHHRNNPSRKFGALFTAIDFTPHVKNCRNFAEKKNMVHYGQFGFVSSTFAVYENVISNVRGPERSDRTLKLASQTTVKKAARRFYPEHKQYYLL